MKKIISESGLKDINKLRHEFTDVVIAFHQDLDGVTTAIGMKNYLESYGFNIIEAVVIQYGDKEWTLKKSNPDKKILYVLVDFAHGKPMFKIHIDHHDTQVGVESGTSTSFRQSRSNVETISQVISPKDLFPNEDILLISTVDSANFAYNEVTINQVLNFIFKFDKDSSLKSNKFALGLVTNKLLLAFKNKPGFLEELVMKSKPSLMSILLNIKRIMLERGFVSPEILKKNQEEYIKNMETSPNVKVEDGVISQYGGGKMIAPGSYDRYTPFKNNPDADFLVIAWPLGLVQASCNPFKKDRSLKGINLGEIGKEVLSKWENKLKDTKVSLSTIKWISESSKDFSTESVGFTFRDFAAIYGKSFTTIDDGKDKLLQIGVLMEKPFSELTEEEKKILDGVFVTGWDIIKANSGGHKCITNISGLNYLGRSKRPPEGKYKYNSESEDSPYVKFTKMIQQEFTKVLKEKLKNSENTIE
jgi:hypothetical protein